LLERGPCFILRCEHRQDHLTIDSDGAVDCPGLVVDGDEVATLTPAQYGERVRERIGGGPVYMSFDIDVLDPAFAPGTGTPEVAGLYPREALGFLRALAGIRFTGFDLVEVSPAYDGPGQTTALHGAAIAFEMLALAAVARR
jgi:agmatinase